jgi:hypothetical protein
MKTFTYRSIHIVYEGGTIENLFGVAGHIQTEPLLDGETEVTFFANSGGWQPKLTRYLQQKDRLEIRTHTVTVG